MAMMEDIRSHDLNGVEGEEGCVISTRKTRTKVESQNGEECQNVVETVNLILSTQSQKSS
jgi:hypothetical protein